MELAVGPRVHRLVGRLGAGSGAPPAAATGTFLVMAVAQVAYPLAASARAGLATMVVAALAATTALLAAATWGGRRAALAVVAIACLTFAVEAVGIRTGYPFGDYAYGTELRPMLLGVPLVVPLAWVGLAIPAYAVAVAVTDRGWLRVVVGALALTAWDLFLDPQMLHEGFWRWADPGAYRDVPVSDLTGWLVVAVFVMLLLDALPRPSGTLRWLQDLYMWTWAMETLGFVAFFRDELVALVGGLAMGAVCMVLALRRRTARG